MTKSRTRDKKAPLEAARRAQLLLDTKVKKDDFGDVEGVDELETGLRAMASALAQLYDFPYANEPTRPPLDEVLAFLSSQKRIETEAAERARSLQETLQIARYQGLSEFDDEEIDEERRALYDCLEALLCGAEKALSDG